MGKTISQTTANRSITLLAIILLISSLGQVTSDLYLPSLPNMAKNLGVSIHAIQFTIAIYMTGFSVSQLVYGPWSDAIGRRTPLLIGLSINLIGSLLCWGAPNIYILLLGRFLQGLGVGAANSLTRPILRDLFEKEKLAIYNSYLAISGILVLSTAPILGGYIQYYLSWRYNFLYLSLYGFIILCSFYFKIPETNQHYDRNNYKLKVILKNARYLLTSPIFLKFSLCPLLTYAGVVAWLTAAPVVLQETVGLNAVQFGWIYLFSGMGFATGSFINIKFVTTQGIEKMISFGFYCQLLAGGLMLLFYLMAYINTYVILMPIILFMLGSSLVFPNASTGSLTPFPKIAGMAGAFFGFIQVLGGTISSTIIALAHDENQFPIAIAFIITALLSMLGFRVFTSNDLRHTLSKSHNEKV
ncbi:MAG: multidrug effflux MFS transporter [Gammaproteobacteria bacterium]|nr:multidrug effflux MFS transporter [Gammaproteobacteria bacterium]